MRSSSLSLALSGFLLLPLFARAETFNFSAVGAGSGFSGSGVLEATGNANGSYTITGISGTGVTGLVAPGVFGNDNLLFPNASRLVDVLGFAFTTVTAGESYTVNLFSNLTGYEAFTLDADGNYSDTPVSFALASSAGATPEPSSFVLLGSGVSALAGVSFRKRRSL